MKNKSVEIRHRGKNNDSFHLSLKHLKMYFVLLGSTELYPVLSKNKAQFFSISSLPNFTMCRREELGMCLSLGNTAAFIHVMNSTYFPKK